MAIASLGESAISKVTALHCHFAAQEFIGQFAAATGKPIRIHVFVILKELVLQVMEGAKCFRSLLYDS